jgi:hypothetical protein
MNQTAAILLMYLMFGQFMILMCGAFLLWWMGDFGGRRFAGNRATQPAGKTTAVANDAKPATEGGAWLVSPTDDHSIAPRVAAGALEHDNDAAPAHDHAVRA